MHRYEIWFIHNWRRDKKVRLCVIISPKELDYLKTRIIALITSKGFDAPYRVNFILQNKKAKILCDQIRCVSADNFISKIDKLSGEKIYELRAILKEMF